MPRPSSTTTDDLESWWSSGAADLCGRATGPALTPPARLLPHVRGVCTRIAELTARLGSPVVLDPVGILTERSRLLGLQRHGTTSCGGAARLVPGGDGWMVVSLSRPDDLDLLPAWLGCRPVDTREAGFTAIADRTRHEAVDALVEMGVELGLAVARVGSVTIDNGPPAISAQMGLATPLRSLDGAVIVDLSSLWAGPLCTRILADAGATVIKVESTRRPDSGRTAAPAFFDLMNAGKRSVALDFTSEDGRGALRSLVNGADVVIEASRPRALAGLGLDPVEALTGVARVWLSITGYGRSGIDGQRIAFGDDAAAAGGAVVTDDDGPLFCGDALADPLAGLAAAAATLKALVTGGKWMIDVAMARCAAHVAPLPGEQASGIDRAVTDRAPLPDVPTRGTAATFGRDTSAVITSFSSRAQ